ncbi:rRNA maturation RNase YbeY [Pelagibacteraceae bacterium]|nr:rRNA maturation RNase YbeY [Pelagibacteraceae bacterium]
MIKINVINNNVKWFRFIKNPNSYIDKKIKRLNSKNKKFKKNIIYCTLLLSGDKEIKNLNIKFRKKNKSTDVLSFPFHTEKSLKTLLKKEKEIYLGDIIINYGKVKYKKNMNIFKSSFDKLWVHGLVHLFGHDHKKEKEFKKMHQVETEYLNYIK